MNSKDLEQEALSDEVLRLRQETADLKSTLELERRRCAEHIGQAEASAKESREQLEFILRSANIGSWEWDVQTGEVRDDRHWVQPLGYQVGEIKSGTRHWSEFFHPDDSPTMGKSFTAHSEGLTPFYEAECRVRNRSGAWICMLDSDVAFLQKPFTVESLIRKVREVIG